MKKTKIFFAAFMVLLSVIFIHERAFADVKSLLVQDKETGITYNYGYKALQNSLINSTLGLDAPLWEEFNAKSRSYKINAIYHDSGRFIPYLQIEEACIKNALANKDFNLDYFVANEASDAADIPAEFAGFIKDKDRVVAIFKDNVLLQGETNKKLVIDGDLYISGNNTSIKNIIVKGSLIISPGARGKASIESVTAEKIEVLSGEENGIKFNKVEAKILKVNEKIKNPVTGLETSKIQETNYKPDNNQVYNSPVENINKIQASVIKTERNEKEINLTINIKNISSEFITIAIYDKSNKKLCYIDQTKTGDIINKSFSFTTVLDKANYEAVIKDSNGKSVKLNF